VSRGWLTLAPPLKSKITGVEKKTMIQSETIVHINSRDGCIKKLHLEKKLLLLTLYPTGLPQVKSFAVFQFSSG
jgi:hypothetical protein